MITKFTKLSLGSLILIAAIALGFAVSCSGKSATDNFIREASVGNQFEIMSSQMAIQNSQNPAIKQYAQQMIDDHTQVGNQLGAIIASNNLTQPPASVDAKRQKMLDQLTSAGADFDKTYVQMQIDAHNSTITLFDDYARSGDNDALKSFAANTLPILRQHLDRIKQIQSAMQQPQ